MNLRTDEKQKIEYVLFVLDESGSMQETIKETIGGVNEQIQELKRDRGIETYVSLVKFSSTVKTLYWNKPASEVEELTRETFVPTGSTAMLDAVGQSICRLKSDTPVRDNDDITFLVIIVSDGMENASREYTWESVQKVVSECKGMKRWTITYMGSNQDLSAVRSQLNLDAGNVLSYTSTAVGTLTGYSTMSSSLAQYRGLRASNTADALAASGALGGFYTTGSSSNVGTYPDSIISQTYS